MKPPRTLKAWGKMGTVTNRTTAVLLVAEWTVVGFFFFSQEKNLPIRAIYEAGHNNDHDGGGCCC